MATYPECDRYECPECPRQDDCVDRDWRPEEDDSLAADAFLDYIDGRLQELEEAIAHLTRFEERVMRILAAIVKTSEEDE